MKKVLFTSHTANFQKFNHPFMKWFKDQGYEVHYASMGEEPVLHCDKHHKISFNRSPFSLDNVKAYKPLKRIIDSENYDIIHCHTPMGGVVTRLAARATRKRGTKVIYTAHGFHFYKGAPIQNWVIYYPVEKFLSLFTDALVTINTEDYNRARKKMKTKEIIKIDGVGVDFTRFRPVKDADQKTALRKKYGFNEDDLILICVAELNGNKNQEFLIRCIKELTLTTPQIKLLLCGDGGYKDKYLDLVKELDLTESVFLLGYRKDVNMLMQLSDIGVAASMREGLGLNIIEELATGLPVLASYNRGHIDIVSDEKLGLLYSLNSIQEFIIKFNRIHHIRSKNYINARYKAVQKFSYLKAIDSLKPTYTTLPLGHIKSKDKTDKIINHSLDLGPDSVFYGKLKSSNGSLKQIRKIVEEQTAIIGTDNGRKY